MIETYQPRPGFWAAAETLRDQVEDRIRYCESALINADQENREYWLNHSANARALRRILNDMWGD